MAQRAIVHLCKIHTLEAMEVGRQAACVKKLLEAELARLGGGGARYGWCFVEVLGSERTFGLSSAQLGGQY